MRTLHSIGRDYLAQITAFAASLADRLLVPAIFLRSLGVTDFSAWGVVLAAGSLVSVLDLGVTRYLANRLVRLVESGSKGEATVLFSEALAMMLVIAVVAPLVIIASGFEGAFATGESEVDRILVEVLIPISVALSFRMFIGLFLVLYRAHGAFRVETWALASADLVRTACVVGALLFGASLLELAWIYAGTTIAISLTFVPLALVRFREFSWKVRLPGPATRRDAFRAAPGLGLSNGFNIAYTAVPTIILGLMQPGAAALAQFILIRTLGNFARQMVNLFSSVFGLELARRAAREDKAGYVKVFAETSRFLAVQVAVGAAMLMMFGSSMFSVWTGWPALFELPILIAAVAPLLLAPHSLLVQEALTYHNLPWPIVRARIAQTTVSVAAFLLVPIEAMQFRMMVALSLGEVIGLSVPIFFALAKAVPGISIRLLFAPALRSIAVCVLAAGIMLPVRLLTPVEPWIQFACGAVTAGVVLVAAVLLFGVDKARRRDLFAIAAQLRTRDFGRPKG
jgi:hypothetical protein